MAERRNSPLNSGKFNSMEFESSDPFSVRQRAPLITRNPPIKTTLAAIFFLVGGIIFLSLGFSTLWTSFLNHNKDKAIGLLVLGGIMFLPGSYASAVIVGTYLGWDGYDYSIIPSYDE